MNRAIALCVLISLALSGCAAGAEDTTLADAVAYLESQQNPDGGYAAAANASSDFSTSAWVALALVAGGASSESIEGVKAYLRSQSGNVSRNDTGSFSATNAVSLYVLSGLALGVPDARWDATDPLARLEQEARNQSLGLNEKVVLVGTLGRAGRWSAAEDFREQLLEGLGNQSSELTTDGWFRAHAILAMLATGTRAEDPLARQWARSMLDFQQDESGFRSSAAYGPDASTTAGALAVLGKIRFVYSHERTEGTEFIQDLQQADGSIRFSQELDFARSKTTAEAILGLTSKGPFAV